MDSSHINKQTYETCISSNEIYTGRVVHLREDLVSLPSGEHRTREVVDHVPAVCVLPVMESGDLILIRQFRYAVASVMMECPAGCMEDGEDPLVAAKRELREETGIQASEWISLGGAYLAPGFCNEYMYFYLAKNLQFGETDFDDDENIETVTISQDEFKTLLSSDKIKDGKTVIAYHLAQAYL